MDRRRFCQWAAASMVLRRAPAIGQDQTRYVPGRPFTWRDAEDRTNVEGIAISPNGSRFALEVTRPLGKGGRYAGFSYRTLLDLRGDVWLLDDRLERPRKLNHGTWGAWSACFSPDGRQLAALTLTEDGKVGVIIWDVETSKYRIYTNTNVELFYATFGTARSKYAGPSGFFQLPRQYVWLDANSLLYVDRGDNLQQSLLATANLSPTEVTLRGRMESGKVSVRVWNADAPTCGSGSRLVRLRCDTGERETIYVGDVRGVSVSPNRQWGALLVATEHVRPQPDTPISSALLQTGPAGDLMVVLKLSIVALTRQGLPHDAEEVVTVGAVAPSRLPVWSSDSCRVAVPVRTTYSDVPSTGNDAVWEVTLNTLKSRNLHASSALDAELVAALITTDELNTAAAMKRRPKTVDPSDYTAGGQIRGGAWRCGGQEVMLWSAQVLTLLTRNRVMTLPGKFASVQPPVMQSTAGKTLAVRVDGLTVLITILGDSYHIEPLQTSQNWEFLGLRPSDGTAVYKEDVDTGTFLVFSRPGQSARRSALSFNTYFRDIIKPMCSVVTRTSQEGIVTRGLLQLPIGHKAGDRHPTIIWAYPGASPRPHEAFTRANSYDNVVLPVQYLLTKGFAFFHAPFLINERSGSLNPMRAAADAVLPWLDVLDRQAGVIPGEYGFLGHSNSGYVALALEALTDRFKAIAAWATFPEIGYSDLHSNALDVALNCGGSVIQANRWLYEDQNQPYNPQPLPPWRNAAVYIHNDPLFNLRNASTPLLLIEGEFDSDPQGMETVYSILYGSGVPVELAYYWGEGHIFASPGNVHDSWLRTWQFFRKYLRRR